MIFDCKKSCYNVKVCDIEELEFHQSYKTYFSRPKLELDFLPNPWLFF